MAYDADNVFSKIDKESDIVKVVSYFLGADKVQRKGRNYVSLCPFHNDTHPSMQINTERNTFKCFVCGKGGGSITFVKEYNKINYREAALKVCEICSIPVPESLQRPVRKDPLEEQYSREFQALKELSEFYRLYLMTKDGEKAMDYLSQRGIDKETIEHFSIGFAPSDPTLSVKTLRAKGFDVPVLEKAGILSNTREIKDRFQSRIMFPIKDPKGRVVAFSGRKLYEDQPGGKYVNSPETVLFKKSETLFHLDQARQTIARDGFIYVLEGYMDVIAMTRAGINSSVACMGTAFTKEHCLILKNLGVEVRVMLDSDDAGQQGTERLLSMLNLQDVKSKAVWKLTGAKDADELLLSHGKDELVKQSRRLLSPFMYFWGRRITSSNGNMTPSDIERVSNETAPFYRKLSSIEKAHDLTQLSKRLGYTKEDLSSLFEEKAENKSPLPSYKEKTNRWRKDYQNKEQVRVAKFSLGGRYNSLSSIVELQEYLIQLDEKKNLIPQLVKSETEIAFILCKKREAYEKFVSSKCVFFEEEYNIFAELIGNIYLSDEEIPSFSDKEFDLLVSRIEGTEAISKNSLEDDFDLFDLSDFEEHKIDLSEDKKNFLITLINLIKNTPDIQYSEDNFSKALSIHHWCYLLQKQKDETNMKYSPGEVPSSEDIKREAYLKKELKKAGGSI